MDTPSNTRGARAGWDHIWRGDRIPPVFQSFAPPNPTVIEWADTLPAGSYLLDVGCGVGRHMVYLGGRGFRVAGLDVSPGGIDLAAQACAGRGITFEGQVSDMTTLPWPDGTFDGALSTSTIHHHRRADVIRALDEVRRVLKPGGSFLVDFPSTNTTVYAQIRQQVATGLIHEVEPDTFVDDRPDSYDLDGFLPHHFCTEAETRDLLRDFEIVRLHEALFEDQGTIKGKWVAWARRTE